MSVKKLLTDDQKQTHIEIGQEWLVTANDNDNFLKNFITGDETWVYGYDTETKVQSSQWAGKGSPRPKISTQESVKDQGDVGCVFLPQRHCPSGIYTMWSDGKRESIPRNSSAFERSRAQ